MTFQERYKKLNEKQRQAVDAIYGPVLVIAWPGSGKTELLSVRIANILQKTDANPANILCLTFTDNAAKNMRERLKRIIWQDAYKVAIHTFHTFGMEILNRYQYKLQEENELTPIDDFASSQIFHEIISQLPWNHIWKKSYSLPTIKNSIKQLKDAGISPEDFKNILQINEQILNYIWPKIEDCFEKINTFGRKKEDIAKKMEIFSELTTSLYNNNFPKKYQLHDTLMVSFLDSMEEVVQSQDSKLLTAWKNAWLEKNHKWNLTPKDHEKMKKSWALLEIYKKYQEILVKNGFIDFSDMILRAWKIIKNDEVARFNTAEQYQWILIDEYQDTNDAQLSLVNSITAVSDFPNIFAVGDDDQSIYKFQGANIRNIKLFKELYPDTQLIILNTNYRSHKEIIDFSRSIISSPNKIHELFPGNIKEFLSFQGEWWEIRKWEFETELDEIYHVVEDIEKIIQKNKENPHFSLSEIAVITRKNATLELVGKALLDKKIPVQLSKEDNIFNDEIIILLKNILLYIYSLKTGNDRNDLLIEILSHEIWNIHRLTLWEISRKVYAAKKEENKNWIEQLRTHSDKNISKIAYFFIELTLLSNTKRLEEIIDIIIGSNTINLSEDYLDENPNREQITLIIDESETSFVSPIFEKFFSEENLKKNPLKYTIYLANIRKIIDCIRAYKKTKPRLMLEDFIEYIQLIDEYEVNLTTSTLIGSEDAVQCITGHKSKWLEYSYVYATWLTEGNFSGTKNNGTPFPSNLSLAPEKDNTEDVERLLYTIFTRAKNCLTISFSKKNLNEKSDVPVSVLGNITDWRKIEQLSSEKCSNILKNEYKNIIELPFSGDEEVFLKNIISGNFSFSATAIQNFLNVVDGGPLNYLSRNVIQFPQAKSPDAIYGSAIHKALENFFTDYSIKKTFQKAILEKSFVEYLQKEGLDEETEKIFLERGKQNLNDIYEQLKTREYGEIHLEHRFNLDGGGTFLDGIRLTGAIDRIEITKDQKLIITDYKTGGGFADFGGYSSGYEAIKKWKYDLQLVFYAILFEASSRWNPWKQREFELLFVEADKKTWEFYRVQKFVQKDEMERLKKLIKIIAEHIENLNFPDVSSYSADVHGIRQFEEDLLNGVI